MLSVLRVMVKEVMEVCLTLPHGLSNASPDAFRGVGISRSFLLVVVDVVRHVKEMESTFVMDWTFINYIIIVFQEKKRIFGNIFDVFQRI